MSVQRFRTMWQAHPHFALTKLPPEICANRDCTRTSRASIEWVHTSDLKVHTGDTTTSYLGTSSEERVEQTAGKVPQRNSKGGYQATLSLGLLRSLIGINRERSLDVRLG
jgi:hypothetical protein